MVAENEMKNDGSANSPTSVLEDEVCYRYRHRSLLFFLLLN